MAENTTHYGLNLDDFLWVLGFPLSMLNRHQRKTTLLDWHCSACSLFLKLPTVKKTTKRLTGDFNVLFNTDQRCWILKTSLAFQLNDVSQFCRLFFCSQVCHSVQWCSVILIQLFLCSQVWSKVLNSFAHLVQHRTTKLCSRLLNNVEWVWPSHKVCKRKTQRAWANKMRAQPGLKAKRRGKFEPLIPQHEKVSP